MAFLLISYECGTTPNRHYAVISVQLESEIGIGLDTIYCKPIDSGIPSPISKIGNRIRLEKTLQ